MNWIHVEDRHFVDLKVTEGGNSIITEWSENKNSPNSYFLIGIDTSSGLYCEVVSLCELSDLVDVDDNSISYSIADVEWWCEIEDPYDEILHRSLKLALEYETLHRGDGRDWINMEVYLLRELLGKYDILKGKTNDEIQNILLGCEIKDHCEILKDLAVVISCCDEDIQDISDIIQSKVGEIGLKA